MPVHHRRSSTGLRPASLRPTRSVRPGPWACLLGFGLGLGLGLPAAGAHAEGLLDLYRAANDYDAAYLSARARAESAIYRAAQADALARPSAAATGSVNASVIDVPNRGTGDSHTIQGAVNGRYPLFNRANGVTIEQARKSQEIAQTELQSAEHDLIVRLSTAYFNVLAGQDALTTTRANKAAITEQLASAKRNFEVGTATITDTREAQARFDLATAQEIFADNDLRTRQIALDQLVGRNGVVPAPLAVPVELPPIVPASPQDWLAQADSVHPAVRRARLGFDVARLETAKARAGELPTVDAVATLGSSRASGSAATVGGITTNGGLGLQLNWPLYTGGSTQNRIRETLSLEESARNDLENARRGVAQGAQVAYYGVQSGRAQVQALEAAESSTQLALEATQLGYKVGVRVNLDVLNAQTQLFTTRRDLARARYDVLLNGLKLRQAAGQLGPDDVAAVDRLLAR